MKIVSALFFVLLCNLLSIGQTFFGSEHFLINYANGALDPDEVIIIDIDNDGYNDIVYEAQSVFWIKNMGLGGFSAPKRLVGNSGNGDIEFTDIDNDGDQDLFVAGFSEDNISFYLNNGNGVFGNQIIVDDDLNFAYFVKAIDINNDGDIDIVASTPTLNKVLWFENMGNTSFSSRKTLIDGFGTISSLAVNDLGGDGNVDIVISANTQQQLIYYKGNGNGNFSTDGIVLANEMNNPTSIVLDDLDLDGDVDVLVAESNDNRTVWFENFGNDDFSSRLIIGNNTMGVNDAKAFDLDLDLDLDILTVSKINGQLSWFENMGDTLYSAEKSISTMAVGGRSVYANDLNNDGILDIAYTSNEAQKVAIHYGTVNGQFGDEIIVAIGSVDFDNIVSFDLENDGDNDIVALGTGQDELISFSNEGDGNFIVKQVIAPSSTSNAELIATDIDQDGYMDLVGSGNFAFQLHWYKNNGNGFFNEAQLISDNLNGLSTLFVIDLDNDGDQDIISGSFNDDKVSWHENINSGTLFEEHIISNDIDFPSNILSFDVDGGSDVDVIVADRLNNRMVWFENVDEVFSERIIALGACISSFDFGDIDGDGDIDIASAEGCDSSFAWYQNDGNGLFSKWIVEDEIALPVKVVVEDIDNDGDNDLIGLSNRNDVSIFSNTGAGSFNDQQIIFTCDCNTILPVDIDGDNDLDLIITPISYHENFLDVPVTAISGMVYWDVNENSIFDNDDVALNSATVQVEPENSIFHVNNNGMFYAFTANAGNHNLSVNLPDIEDCIGLIDFELIQPSSMVFPFQFADTATYYQDFVFNAEKKCKEVTGNIFNDNNGNGVKEPLERGLSGIYVKADGFGNTFSSNNGDYKFSIPKDESSNISMNLQYQNFNHYYCLDDNQTYNQTLPPNNLTYPINGSMDVGNLDFGVQIDNVSGFDVGIYSFGVHAGNQAGVSFKSWIDFKAVGLISEPCTLRIEHNPLVNFVSAHVPPTNIENTYIEWVFQGSKPRVACFVAEWLIDSSAMENDTLHWEATYYCPPSIDRCETNNTASVDVPIISGPLRIQNSNVVMHSVRAEGIMPERINNEAVLSYLVYFQNPLNAVANSVTFIDTLPEELDLTTISKPFASFPNYDFFLSEDGVLKLTFNGIQLSNVDEDQLNSYGFVQFNAKLKEGLDPGTVISNKATIKFNEIEATTTNTITHIIDEVSSVIQGSNFDNLEVSIYPNPFVSQTTFQLNQSPSFNYDLVVSDMLGNKKIDFRNLETSRFVIKTGDLPKGIYLVNLFKSGADKLLGSYKLIVN